MKIVRADRISGWPEGRPTSVTARTSPSRSRADPISGTVHEERRRPVHTTVLSADEILVHPVGIDTAGQLALKPLDVQVQLSGKTDQRFVVERVLVPKEQIVHFPEFALFRCSLRRFRRLLRMVVADRDRIMPEDETDPAGQRPEEAAYDRIGGKAMRAFEVAILDKRDRGLNRSKGMIAGRNGNGQILAH